jgi:carbon storage regulator
MLVLSRKLGESIMIGDGVTVCVTRLSATRVSLGIDAPEAKSVFRKEIAPHDHSKPAMDGCEPPESQAKRR